LISDIKSKFKKTKNKYQEKFAMFDEWILGMSVSACIIMIVLGRAVKDTTRRKDKK